MGVLDNRQSAKVVQESAKLKEIAEPRQGLAHVWTEFPILAYVVEYGRGRQDKLGDKG